MTPEPERADSIEWKRKVIAAILEERARCLAIANLYPDNLMAREIARRIAEGPQ